MHDPKRLLLFLLISGGVTLLLRELPFLLFRNRTVPATVLYLGRTLPMALMCLLVLYCVKDISFTVMSGWIPYAVSVAVTVGVHLFRKSTTLSIFCGTACYMILIRVLV